MRDKRVPRQRQPGEGASGRGRGALCCCWIRRYPHTNPHGPGIHVPRHGDKREGEGRRRAQRCGHPRGAGHRGSSSTPKFPPASRASLSPPPPRGAGRTRQTLGEQKPTGGVWEHRGYSQSVRGSQVAGLELSHAWALVVLGSRAGPVLTAEEMLLLLTYRWSEED